MFKIVVDWYSKEFNTGKEAKEYCNRMVKCHRSFDVYKNGQLVATGDSTGIYPVKRKRSKITGSIGYAKMMSEI